jgi:hypothetical protein
LETSLAITLGNQILYQPYENKLDSLIQQRNQAWAVFGLIWGYSLYDAFRLPLNTPSKTSELKILPILRPNYTPQMPGTESFYGLSIHFKLE